VYGACDPISGVASILETATVLSALKNEGWRPERNIIFAFWDAEEYGLLGSSRWVLQNLAKVQKQIAAQVYVDSIRSKNFTAYITPGLEKELEEALKYTADPEQQRPYAEFHGTFSLPGYSDDTTPFTGFTGTPSARLGFGTHYSMYHSLYDDPMWMGKFGDPGYKFTASLVKILSLYIRSLSTDRLLPFRFSPISFAIQDKAANQNISDAGLDAELQKYDQAAKQLDELLNGKQDVSPSTAGRTNALLLEAMQSFASFPDEPFPKRNVLIGSSESEGCVGELAPAISSAKQQEIQRLISGVERSRQLLLQTIDLLK
jgi:hypothetical protein